MMRARMQKLLQSLIRLLRQLTMSQQDQKRMRSEVADLEDSGGMAAGEAG